MMTRIKTKRREFLIEKMFLESHMRRSELNKKRK